MATKKTTQKNKKKQAAKKAPVKAKEISKKASVKSTVKTTTKNTSPKLHPYALLGISLGFSVLTYGFASWAIDSGSLWHYLATFISVYFAVTYFQQFLKARS